MRPTTFKVDNVIYWAIRTYTDAGVLVDADSTPSVAVRKNGASAVDAVTVTKRAATTGIYDCSYNPSGEAEGDCFAIEETATISSQAYEFAWNIEALAPERGTDGANTVTPNTVTPATPSDLSGLSTFDPASDQVVASNMRGTDGSNTVAPDNASIAAILADTSELQGSQGDWATATGFATPADVAGAQGAITTAIAGLNDFDPANDVVAHVGLVDTTTDLTNQASGGTNPADIYNYFTDGSREDAFKANTAGLSTYDPASDLVITDAASRNASKADVSGLASQSSVDAVENKVDSLVADSSGWATADVSGLATQASVDVIDSNVDEIKSAIATTVIPNQVVSSGLMINVKAVTDKVDTMLQADGSNFQYTIDALALAPTGSGGGGTGASSAEIYNYFTSNGREVVFQADVSGLSTFDPATDQVTAGNMVAEAPTEAEVYNYFVSGTREDAFKANVSNLATSSQVTGIDVPSESDVYNYFTSGSREDQFKANVSGLSTLDSGDVTNAVTTSLNSYDAAKGSEITSAKNEVISDIASLNDFDPANDTVSNVNTVQTVINGGSGGGGGDATAANQSIIISAINDLNDFDPNSDVVQNVNTVQTVISGGGSGGGGGGGSITVNATPTPMAF